MTVGKLQKLWVGVITVLFLGYDASGQEWDCPVLNLTIAFNKSTFRAGEDIRLRMTLENRLDTVQRIWFTRPSTTTGGPALTSVELLNKNTGESVVKYANKAILSSQIYLPSQVQKELTPIGPGKKLYGEFALSSLVYFKYDDQTLPKGDYELKVYYCSNPSNIIRFKVR